MKSRSLESPRPRLKAEDVARSVAYLILAAWATVFLFFPPISFASGLETGTRIAWLSLVLGASLTAFFGSVTSRDLKVEMVALYPLLAGPGLYFLGLVWYLFFPAALPPGIPAEPIQRIAGAVFALYATASLLPRLFNLREKGRQTKLAIIASTSTTLTEAQKAQPGAFPEFSKGGLQ